MYATPQSKQLIKDQSKNNSTKLGYWSQPITYMMRTTLFLFLLCLLCSSHACLAAADDVLNAGQNITGTTTTLVSNTTQAFVLGFFSPPKSPSKSYLGIWYNEELYPGKQKLVVWVANRGNPVVGSNGIFQIAEDGNLVVTNTSGGIHWSSDLKGSSSSRNRTVKLMDSGNLVLMDGLNGMSYIWQSFQHPTDTFLPGMEMDTSLELTSWVGDSDPRSGSFTFKMAQTGANRYVIFNNDQHQLYWENNGLNSDALIPDALSYLANFTFNISSPKLVDRSRSSKSMDLSYGDGNRTWESWYADKQDTRIVMNSTGEIQFLKWENSEWILLWKQPSDKCNINNYCGNFSSCNSNDWMNCKCLPGFIPMSVENNQIQTYPGSSGFHGCLRKSTSYDNSSKDLVFLNLTMIRIGTPDTIIPADTEEQCQSLCLNMSRPRCQAYQYNSSSISSDYYRRSIMCGIWTQDLTTLRVVEDGASDLSILVKSSDIAPTARSCEPCGIYTIPYPLSTGPNCGDPMYNNFSCDYSTGQVSFKMPRGESYRVTWIEESSRKFYIQTSDSFLCYPFQNQPQIFKPGSVFDVTNLCFREDDVEISWVLPPEPPCLEPADCNNWPNSTCSETREGKRRCLCNSNYKWNATVLTCTPEENSRNRLSLILTIAGMIFLACTIIFAYVWRSKIAPKIDMENTQIQESLYDSERHVKGLIGLGGLEEKGSESIEVPFYTFGSIVAATDNFSDANMLGRGGYGPVYKGRFSGGQDIAVKRLSSVSNQGLEEFRNEVVLIAKLQHRNLVRLRGYCIHGDEKILLYEYMSNKSLDSFIFDRSRTLLLDWQMRFDIILGIARGLLYLHQDSILRVIHRDLKTSNILLDEDMIPKISDFGLAKIFGGKETEANTNRVVGTYGYMAPDYALDGFFSIKSDVFSFGVVMLEILSGKQNTGFYQSKRTSSLLGYAWGLWTENRLLDLMDSSLCGACNENQFIKCALIGLLCVQDEPCDRPTMSNIVTMLDSEIATIPTPTQPTFYAMRRIPSNSASSSSSKPETTLHFDTSYQQGR